MTYCKTTVKSGKSKRKPSRALEDPVPGPPNFCCFFVGSPNHPLTPTGLLLTPWTGSIGGELRVDERPVSHP